MEKRIKKTFVCRDVLYTTADASIGMHYQPESGDVALFEVLSIGKHKQVQGASGRNCLILPGDTIMAAFGTRYATAQFEGYIPESPQEEYHILGAGGTVGIVHSTHSKFEKMGPTTLRLIGYVTNPKGQIVNTKDIYSNQMISFSGCRKGPARIILSIGATMDSGKTTTAAYMVRGLRLAGKKTAFIKLTGTIYTKDRDMVFDMGADMAIDFGDLGFPSTYYATEQELLDLYETLVQRTMAVQPDFIVMEIADGILQRETAMLLKNKAFMQTIDEVIFSCGDSLSALHGLQVLESHQIFPFAICGTLTASPLLVREVQDLVDCPILTLQQLQDGAPLQLINRPVLQFAS